MAKAKTHRNNTQERKTVLIHIGLHKTGTTAIQEFLTLNRNTLMHNGILYPGIGFGPRSHRRLALSITPGSALGVMAGDFRNRLRKVGQFGDASDCHTVLLSSEFFSILEANQIREFLKWLEPGLVKVVVFFRRQDHWIESLYNQIIKNKDRFVAPTLAQFMQRKDVLARLDYYEFLRPWAESVGEDNISIGTYEKHKLADGVVPAFLKLCGFPEAEFSSPAASSDINPRLSRDEFEFLYLIKSAELADVEKKAASKILFDSVKLLGPGVTFMYKDFMSNFERCVLLDRYEKSNNRVAREYLGREDGALFSERRPDPSEAWEPYPGLRAEAVAEIFGRMEYVIENQNDKLFGVDCQSLIVKLAAAILHYNIIKSRESSR